MAIQLDLSKPGTEAKRFVLDLRKAETFKVLLSWESDHDPDAHALLCANGRVTDAEHILSTHNVVRPTHPAGALKLNSDESFGLPNGALLHSGDALTGKPEGVAESITVNGAAIPSGINEVPVFITLFPKYGRQPKFREVKGATVTITDESSKPIVVDGKPMIFRLSDEFGEFDAVQPVNFVLGPNGWEVVLVGAGFNGNFNDVLANFS